MAVSPAREECEGKRFQAAVLEYHLGGRDISEVLAMSVTDAEELRRRRRRRPRTPSRRSLADVGLGYFSLGQPLTTPSGGERQRLVLATHMAEKGDVHVPDLADHWASTSPRDVEQLLVC
jgi:excinuclease UvrABC ATPase subunit